ncbi:MAG: anti-sigma factor family protein [Candidatus Aminicenantales bacterium]
MKCSQAHELIGELLEGTISEDDRRELEIHLESCRECRELLADFREIKTQAAELPKIEPSPAVWPNVLDGVRRARREKLTRASATIGWWERLFAPGRPRYALAAALSLGLVIGGAVLIRAPWKKAAPVAAEAVDAYTMAKLEEAEIHYRLAIKALSEAAAAQKSGLDAKTTASLEADLQTIDAVIASCRTAVQHNPQSVEARVYLLGAYKGKVEFLDNIIAANKKSASPSAADIVL